MRLKPEKIEDLARKIIDEMKTHKEVLFRVSEEEIFHEIKEVIIRDLEREDKLEEEVHQILKQHMNRVYHKDISYTNLVRKAKKQLAKERGLIL